MNYPDINILLKHDRPMIVIDRVIADGDGWIETEVIVTADHIFYDAGHDALPAWAVIEIMAQSIAAFGGLSAQREGKKIVPGFLLGTRELNFAYSWIGRNSVIRTHVARQYSADDGFGSFNCVTSINGNEFSNGIINVYQAHEDGLP